MDIPRSFAYHFRTVVFQNLIDQETVEFASNLLYFNSPKEEMRYMRPNEIRKKLSYYYIAAIRGKGCFFVNPLSFDELDAAELENDELSELEEQDFSWDGTFRSVSYLFYILDKANAHKNHSYIFKHKQVSLLEIIYFSKDTGLSFWYYGIEGNF